MHIFRMGITVLLWIVGFVCLGQSSKKYKRFLETGNYLEGYVIERDSTVLKGLIQRKPGDSPSLYTGIKFISESGEKRKYRAKDVKGFGYGFEHFVSDGNFVYAQVDKGSRIDIFLRVPKGVGRQIDHSLYLPWQNPGPGDYVFDHTAVYYLRKRGKGYHQISESNFRNSTSKYFSDCQRLSNAIKKKSLKFEDLFEIVRFYNDDCD